MKWKCSESNIVLAATPAAASEEKNIYISTLTVESKEFRCILYVHVHICPIHTGYTYAVHSHILMHTHAVREYRPTNDMFVLYRMCQMSSMWYVVECYFFPFRWTGRAWSWSHIIFAVQALHTFLDICLKLFFKFGFTCQLSNFIKKPTIS